MKMMLKNIQFCFLFVLWLNHKKHTSNLMMIKDTEQIYCFNLQMRNELVFQHAALYLVKLSLSNWSNTYWKLRVIRMPNLLSLAVINYKFGSVCYSIPHKICTFLFCHALFCFVVVLSFKSWWIALIYIFISSRFTVINWLIDCLSTPHT